MQILIIPPTFSVVGTSYQQPSGSLGMSMDNSGVVGKFRSFYSTIEQVTSFLSFPCLLGFNQQI